MCHTNTLSHPLLNIPPPRATQAQPPHCSRPLHAEAGSPLKRSRAYFSNSSTDTSPEGGSLYMVSSTVLALAAAAAAAVPVATPPPVRVETGVFMFVKFMVVLLAHCWAGTGRERRLISVELSGRQ